MKDFAEQKHNSADFSDPSWNQILKLCNHRLDSIENKIERIGTTLNEVNYSLDEVSKNYEEVITKINKLSHPELSIKQMVYAAFGALIVSSVLFLWVLFH